MARYDIRDLLGHWVRPRAREGQHCPHACCRGRRPHPDNFPVLIPRAELRRADEGLLMRHLRRWGHRDDAVNQVIGELDRRERVERNAAARRDRARHRRATRQDEYRAYLENEWIQAERQTKGVMLNRAGERAGVDPRSLFYGPESRARKYASEELRRYWDEHPRVSSREFHSERAQIEGGRGRRASRLYGVY